MKNLHVDIDGKKTSFENAYTEVHYHADDNRISILISYKDNHAVLELCNLQAAKIYSELFYALKESQIQISQVMDGKVVIND